jgi:hypothetical protein
MKQEMGTINDLFRVLGQEYFNKIILAERMTDLEKIVEQQNEKLKEAGKKPLESEIVE